MSATLSRAQMGITSARARSGPGHIPSKAEEKNWREFADIMEFGFLKYGKRPDWKKVVKEWNERKRRPA